MAANYSSILPSSQDTSGHLRIVLIGISGTGKSATGNTLLGENVFKCKQSTKTVTMECEDFQKERFGKAIMVVDTPGFSNLQPDQCVKQLVSCTRRASPGVHAFLLMLRIGHIFNDEDQEAVELMKHMFCEKIMHHTIAVFTGEETLDADGQTLDEYISHLPGGLRKAIQSCKGGAVAISNIGSRDEREETAKMIINKVERVIEQNGGDGQYYKNALFDDVPERIDVNIDRILKGNDGIRDQIRLLKEEVEHLTGEDQHIQRQREKLEKIIDILQKILIDRDTAQYAVVRKKMINWFTSVAVLLRFVGTAVLRLLLKALLWIMR